MFISCSIAYCILYARKRLRTIQYATPADLENGHPVCELCFCEYKKGMGLKILTCKHHFHNNCLDNWFETSEECPVCGDGRYDTRSGYKKSGIIRKIIMLVFFGFIDFS